MYDLFFRKNPFGGEFTIFCGLEEAIRFIATFAFSPEQVDYLRKIIPAVDQGFFDCLSGPLCVGFGLQWLARSQNTTQHTGFKRI